MRLPLIAAPMLRVSGPDLVVAACKAGVVGSFPTANARTPERLADWMSDISKELAGTPAAPVCANLIVRLPNLDEHLAVLTEHGIDMVITSTGSPERVVEPLHAAGALVFADVASIRHAHRAIEAGADGLILLAAGAGGHTGWLNPFAFVRAVREFFDGPLVLAGGVCDGASLLAAQALGCDLAYMGTRFIATQESDASDEYKNMLVTSDADDVILTQAFTGLPTSMLRPAITAAGLDPTALDETVTPEEAKDLYGPAATGIGPKRWTDLFSAGHAVSSVHDIPTVAELVERISTQYDAARA
ncbi:nitronate monooxygenase [Streptomyces sp. NPDC048002]|uniref:NAD(P)H-dependent flavin oxidoreductase n=1 Tax=Streptomyces sp. NPDC048002 TaxID=3154344 RepID=UPI0033CD0055